MFIVVLFLFSKIKRVNNINFNSIINIDKFSLGNNKRKILTLKYFHETIYLNENIELFL